MLKTCARRLSDRQPCLESNSPLRGTWWVTCSSRCKDRSEPYLCCNLPWTSSSSNVRNDLASPAHSHIKIRLGTRRRNNSPGSRTQFHPKVDLDLIWLISNTPQFLHNTLCDGQNLVQRLFQRLLRLD